MWTVSTNAEQTVYLIF